MFTHLDFRGCRLVKGRTRQYELKRFVCIAGDNATGKTTILRAFRDAKFNSNRGTHSDWESCYGKPIVVDRDTETKVIEFCPLHWADANRLENLAAVGDIDYVTLFRALQNGMLTFSGGERSAHYYRWFYDSYRSLVDKPLTLLCDEPEVSLNTATLKAWLFAMSCWLKWPNVQVICASHSPIVWASAEQLIDLQTGYIESELKTLEGAIHDLRDKRKTKSKLR